MSESVRHAIVTTLRRVDGIGTVHDRQRYAVRKEDLRALYIDGQGVLKGWFVRFEARSETEEAIGRYRVVVRWGLYGFRGFDDGAESEKVFAALVEAVAAAFRADDTLGGVVLDTSAPGGAEQGLQVDQVEPVLFAGVLCHHARCRLTTRSLL